jgi:hypothetical protein
MTYADQAYQDLEDFASSIKTDEEPGCCDEGCDRDPRPTPGGWRGHAGGRCGTRLSPRLCARHPERDLPLRSPIGGCGGEVTGLSVNFRTGGQETLLGQKIDLRYPQAYY